MIASGALAGLIFCFCILWHVSFYAITDELITKLVLAFSIQMAAVQINLKEKLLEVVILITM